MVTIPTTETLPQWGFSVGSHWSGEARSESIAGDTDLNKLQVTWGLGLLPDLEVTGQIPVVFYTRAAGRDHRDVGKLRLGMKYRLLNEAEGAPLSFALLGAAAFGTGRSAFPVLQDRNSLYSRRDVWEVMGIVDKVLFATGEGREAVLALNAGGLFFDKPKAGQFRLEDQTVQFRHRFSGTQVTFDNPFEWGIGLDVPLLHYDIADVDFLGEWRGNTGTVDELRGTLPMQIFAGLRWTHESGFGIRGGADFGLSGQLDGYRYLVSVTYATPPKKEAPVIAQPPPPPPPAPPPLPPPAKKKIVLRGVHFDFDKAAIRKDAAPILDEAVSVLKENPRILAEIVGHCDAMGTDAYNDRLSLRRARAVRDYLVRKGIDASRLSVSGKGEREPVASNDTEDGRAQNRRVELKVVE